MDSHGIKEGRDYVNRLVYSFFETIFFLSTFWKKSTAVTFYECIQTVGTYLDR